MDLIMDWDKVIESLLKMIAAADTSATAVEAATALEKVINARNAAIQAGKTSHERRM